MEDENNKVINLLRNMILIINNNKNIKITNEMNNNLKY